MSGTFTIGGLASGLDTAAIVKQLIALERQPLNVLAARRSDWQKVDQAWGQVVTKLSSVRSAIDALRDPQALQKAASATSSAPDTASATITGSPSVGSTSLTVDRLATAHRVAVGPGHASRTDVVAPGSFSVRRPDGSELAAVEITEGMTLDEVAKRFNGIDGLRAQVIDTGADGFQLVLTADRTGGAASFDVVAAPGSEGHPFGSGRVLTEGGDAQLRMGDLSITRPSNVVSDLLDGVELRLTGVGDVTIGVERDLDASVKLVKDIVDSVNGVLDLASRLGRTSQTEGERGALAGDSLLRSLTLQLRNVTSTLTGSGEYGTASSIGLTLGRDGKLALDSAKLREALTAAPDAVGALIGRASTASDDRVGVTATGRAPAGTYELEVTQAASAATVTGASYAGQTEPRTFTITTAAGRAISVTLDPADATPANAVSRINQALRDAGETSVRAKVEGDAIRLDAARPGTAAGFTVSGSGDLGLDDVVAGVNAAGRLVKGDESWDLVGTGTSLRAPTGSTIAGLTVSVPVGETGDLGTVSVADGLAGAFDRIIRAAEGSTGSIASARKGIESRITATTRSIEAGENRLITRERMIRAQYTALESALARLSSQGNWLAGALSGLNPS